MEAEGRVRVLEAELAEAKVRAAVAESRQGGAGAGGIDLNEVGSRNKKSPEWMWTDWGL